MTTEGSPLSLYWALALRLARITLGFTCLALTTAWHGFNVASLLWLLFTLYAAALVFYPDTERAARSTAALVVDVAFFLLWLYDSPARATAASILFFSYVILFAALRLGWKATLATGGATALLLILMRRGFSGEMATTVYAGTLIAVVLAAYKSQVAKRLERTSAQARLLAEEAEKAVERERQRIAADFHDGPLQSFISFQMRLEILRKLLDRDPKAAAQELEQLRDLSKTQTAELRSFIRSMRPPEDETAGLMSATARLVELFQKDTGIVASFHRGGFSDSEEPEASTEILQVVREALNNAHKHSKASRVAVSMEKVQGGLEISIEDDGTGFPFAGAYTLDELEALRLGPVSIKRRVRDLNGEMTLESRPGSGSSMQIRIPL
jgi:signal transduction histidine kinase